MARNKAKQIEEVKSFENVFSQWGEREKPDWSEYFGNEGPIVLELGCGWGQYTLALAARYPEKNFIGVDRKGDRIWVAAKDALSEVKSVGTSGSFGADSLRNVAFLQIEIDKIGEWFKPGEVDEIWITFPDPQPGKVNKRLISPRFLQLYRQVCKPGAIIHLKTDNGMFFEYALSVVGECEEVYRDVHGMTEKPEKLRVLTYYEKKFMEQGVPIKYLNFSLN